MATFNPFPADHYIGRYLAQCDAEQAAGYLLGKVEDIPVNEACGCPHCLCRVEKNRLTRVQPMALTAWQTVSWHVENARAEDRRFRGDPDWAKGYLVDLVAEGWLTEGEANEIRTAVGWPVAPVQLGLFEVLP